MPFVRSITSELNTHFIAGVETSLNFVIPKHFDSQISPNKIKCNDNMTFETEKGKPRESQKYHQGTMQPTYAIDGPGIFMLSMHYIVCAFLKESRNNIDFEQFMSFSKTIFTHERCEMVQKATVGRCKSTYWYNMTYGRVMASQAYDAAHCLRVGSLADQIFGAQHLMKAEPVERAESHEQSIRNVVAKLKNIQIKKPGLVISPDLPYFGASPDGISDDYVIDIKSCNSTITSDIDNGNIGKEHYAEIQTQMHVTKKKMGLFCIAQPDFTISKKIHVYEVPYNETYCDELFSEIAKFWKKYIYKKMIYLQNPGIPLS